MTTTPNSTKSSSQWKGWRFDGSEESFYDGDKRVPYGKLLKMLPGTTECEFAVWAEKNAAKKVTRKKR